jgi:hypothetical protein
MFMFAIAIGGAINMIVLISKTRGSIFNEPHWIQGLVFAFVSGAVIFGLPLWGLYWLLS